ncbi:WD40-repeat-containing domain protein, partial [Schizophyllum fasciatum]
FGTGTMIALWPAEGAGDVGVRETLASDHARVTCVRFLDAVTLASADEQGLVRLWRRREGKWTSTARVQAHTQGVSSLCVRGTLLVTGSSDATVRFWDVRVEEDALRDIQTISLGGRYPLSLALATLPQSSSLILAIGDTSRNVQLWTRSDDKFIRAATLAGHEDWVRALAFREPVRRGKGSSGSGQKIADGESPTLVLASGAQDSSIRLWNIEPVRRGSAEGADDLLDAFEASLGETTDGEEGGRQITLKRHLITVKAGVSIQQYSVTFDALLVGHEAGVTALAWRAGPAPTLLSTSTDSSLILWAPAPAGALWVARQRFGDVGGQRLGGFVGGLWVANGAGALAWGWAGGWRRWACVVGEGDEGEGGMEAWQERGAITGHSGPVKGLAWAPGGEYLLSTGLDQTARIHGAVASSGGAWHEIARPQVHGYDLLRGVFLDRLRYTSIADEKVARVFDAPRSFVESAERLGVATFDASERHTRPQMASLAPLQLSNKATSQDPSAMSATGDITDHRPFEGELAAITLWPESEKVFGHGYELISLAASNSKKLVATACKATTPEHAVVRLHDTARWQPVGQPLPGHSLTVTRIAFSPDDALVLTVSRDRTWRLFARQDDGGYTPIAADKSHGRIIWDCAWAHEGDVFATASRDKTV